MGFPGSRLPFARAARGVRPEQDGWQTRLRARAQQEGDVFFFFEQGSRGTQQRRPSETSSSSEANSRQAGPKRETKAPERVLSCPVVQDVPDARISCLLPLRLEEHQRAAPLDPHTKDTDAVGLAWRYITPESFAFYEEGPLLESPACSLFVTILVLLFYTPQSSAERAENKRKRSCHAAALQAVIAVIAGLPCVKTCVRVRYDKTQENSKNNNCSTHKKSTQEKPNSAEANWVCRAPLLRTATEAELPLQASAETGKKNCDALHFFPAPL
ncbi:hypothetical protein MRX96_042692 [Rhipicephalus microplus]